MWEDKFSFFLKYILKNLLFISGCAGSSLLCRLLVAASGGYSPVAVHRLLIAVAFLVRSTGSRAGGLQWLYHVGSVVVVPGL